MLLNRHDCNFAYVYVQTMFVFVPASLPDDVILVSDL